MKPGRPSAHITIDGRQLSAAESALAGLRVVLSNVSHNTAEMTFWPRTKFASAVAGSSVSIRAGATDTEEDQLSGEVSRVLRTPAAIVIEAVASTVQLSRIRRSQIFLSSSVADIVRDLAGPVNIDEVQADLHLEAYSIDTRRTVWGHLMDLALLAGAETGSSGNGGLRFVPVRTGAADRKFQFGADVLDWKIEKTKPFDPPGIAPHGAASEQGSSRWHWLVRDPVGSSAPASRVIGAFHTRDAADQLKSAVKSRAARSGVRGEVRVVGEPRVRAGELIEISDVPGGDLGLLRVMEVRHELDGRGFLTSLSVEGVGGGLPSLPI